MPNDAIIYSGPYEIRRLRRRRDQRVQEYIFQRSKRTSNPPLNCTMCRITKLVLYLIVFFVVLGLFTAGMAFLVIHFRVPAEKPGERKMPGLCTAPGYFVGDVKHILWSASRSKELGAFRRQMSRLVKPFGMDGDTRMLPCNLDDSWGYTSGKPCILMKLTQALDFEAVTYNDGITLPDEAPDELYDYIVQLATENRLNRIWVACEVTAPENLTVSIDYVPFRYFDADALFTRGNVFLNVSSENESGEIMENPGLRRLIGVQFTNLPNNLDIFIRCQVWAKNIPLDVGSAKFMMHVTAPVSATTESDYLDGLES
ncbi:uncharacterized protein Dana_GF18470 [Drosophila ananassae]|uniref:Sodium/potassium-transporting ATPase subunit beta n=1 Tax=Drosophila ananassae TaxID=7217 RepID=B3M2E7_DROAN|nr:probable sodium/potassium-transporting ATPase subunit beta-3 [Drosophila ananassae]EDV43400.1 uncharacterized protein Dana_GF18470 [Drosophila ananassae]